MRTIAYLLSAAATTASGHPGIRTGRRPRRSLRRRPRTTTSGTAAGSVDAGQAPVATAGLFGQRQRHRHHRDASRRALSNVPIAVSAVGRQRCRIPARTTSASSTSSPRRCWSRRPAREANGSARIRGIGTVGDNPGLESSVAVFIDGVYRSRTGIGLNELGEIDRDRSAARPAGHAVRAATRRPA